MMHPRQGNFVFVGGTHGIGQAAAMAVAATGSSVLLIARDPVAGAIAVDEASRAGASEAQFVSVDLSTIAGMEAAARAILAWKPKIHGILHSAMSAFNTKTLTDDGLELAFALQYLARAMINRLSVSALAASGDGRIVHIAGAVSHRMARPVLEDLQFERRQWGFFKAVLPTHIMGFEFLDEAARRWADRPIGLYATCVGPTRTKAMRSPQMPLIMRAMALVGTKPEKSARNAVRLLTDSAPLERKAAILRRPGRFELAPFVAVPVAEAERLWDITTDLASHHGVVLS